MTPADLDQALVAAVRAAVTAGELTGPVPDEAFLTWEDGCYVSPLPLRLAAGRPPRDVAELVARRVEGVRVTGPGFLAVAVTEPGALARHIVEAGDYGGLPGPLQTVRTWPDRPRTFDNPGFVVRFAHARAASVRRHATGLGLAPGDKTENLTDPYELRLLGLLGELPGRARQAVRERDAAPYQRHLVRVADAYHDVYERCPALPQGDEPAGPVHGARLTLAEAVRIALNNGLRTLGETPEERL